MILLILFCFFTTQTVQATHVHKQVLNNGLTVLVRPTQSTQKVSTQLWIDVGSKHEGTGQRGLAHWLEHMFFKGTGAMSETDIPATTAKLSGSFNAATSYDKTYFFIDLPVQHWYEALPMLADGMTNCTFQQDLINAEVQVVIQELKMYKDHPGRALFNAMSSTYFYDHPYHFPVIGYKNDLKNLTRDDLVAFYQKYYVPSNAVVVIVGNVDVQEAFDAVERAFGGIPYAPKPATPEFVHQEDIMRNTTTLYRNVQQRQVTLSYVIPGFKNSEPCSCPENILAQELGHSRNAVLHKLLVDELQLVNWVYAGIHELFDHSVFSVNFEPKHAKDCTKIIALIQQEIDAVACGNINEQHVAALMKKAKFSHAMFLENNHEQAHEIGLAYLARQDENLFFKECIVSDAQALCAEMQRFAATYLRPAVMHTGFIVPLPEREKETWNRLQKESNAQDAQILADKQRQSAVEAPRYATTVQVQKPLLVDVPRPETIQLDNGLTVHYYHNPHTEKIDLCLKLKADHYYEQGNQANALSMLFGMLEEGTKKYSREMLDDELSQNCIGLHVADGVISMNMLPQDFPKAFKILEELMVRPAFKKDSLEKVKSLALATLKRTRDDQHAVFDGLVHAYLYGEHPYGTRFVTPADIKRVSQKDIQQLHKQYFSPDGAVLVIVGNLSSYDIPALMHKTIARWRGATVPDMIWPEIVPNTDVPTSWVMDREQIILGLAGHSVSRNHPDYYKLVLFHLVFHEKLFNLRSQTGAFYAFQGSLLTGTGEQPGWAGVTVNVSQARVDEVEALLRHVLPQIVASFDEHDLEKAKLNLLNSAAEGYATNGSTLDQFMFCHVHKLPFDYLLERNKILEKISVADVQEAAGRILDPEKLVTFKVGPSTGSGRTE